MSVGIDTRKLALNQDICCHSYERHKEQNRTAQAKMNNLKKVKKLFKKLLSR